MSTKRVGPALPRISLLTQRKTTLLCPIDYAAVSLCFTLAACDNPLVDRALDWRREYIARHATMFFPPVGIFTQDQVKLRLPLQFDSAWTDDLTPSRAKNSSSENENEPHLLTSTEVGVQSARKRRSSGRSNGRVRHTCLTLQSPFFHFCSARLLSTRSNKTLSKFCDMPATR